VNNLLAQWGPRFASAQIQTLVDGVWHLKIGDEAYILKRRSNRTRVWEEFDLLTWLLEHDQPVSLLMCTKENIPWAEHQGSFYVLYRYLHGTPGNELDMLDGSLAQATGSELARLHQALGGYGGSASFPSFDLFQEVSSYAWPTVQAYSSMKFRDRLQGLEQEISTQLVNPYEALPRQLIHRDFHPGNLVFTDGKINGILDFDRVRIGVRLFDLCYLATSVLSEGFGDPKKRERWLGFVQDLVRGYTAVDPLQKTEGHVFSDIMYLIQLLFIAYFLDEGNTTLADLNLGILLWLYEQHDYLQPRIAKTVLDGSRDVIR